MITRRHFIALAGTVVAASVGMLAWYRRKSAKVFGALRLSQMTAEQARIEQVRGLPLEQAIRRYYDFLKLDDAGIRSFVTAHQAGVHAAETGERALEDTLSRYLLSTDFFMHGANEARVVRFVAYHDPNRTPCVNPFARPAA
jgi:hypothetical protein